jgi:ParB-like nuclease domain
MPDPSETPKTVSRAFAADKTERRKIADLIPYPRNPRTHSLEQIDTLCAMITEYGFTQPLLVDEDNMILAGHGRTMAAQKLGFVELPVVVLRGLTDAQKRAIIIADNKSSELAGWDNDLLVLELGELKRLDFDMSLTGFAASDIVNYLASGTGLSGDPNKPPAVLLSDKFGVVPVTILNAREGWWQNRKRAWISLGIMSEVGRGENLLKFSDTVLDAQDGGTRVADKAAAAAHG